MSQRVIDELISEDGEQVVRHMIYGMHIQNILPTLLFRMESGDVSKIADKIDQMYREMRSDGDSDVYSGILRRLTGEAESALHSEELPPKEDWEEVLYTNYSIYSNSIEKKIVNIYRLLRLFS